MRFLPGSISKEIRQCVAENMEREGLKRAFKALGQKHKTEFRKQEAAYQEAKIAAITEWKKDAIEEGEMDEFDVVELASRSTLMRGRRDEAEKKTKKRFKAVKWKTVKIGGKERRVPTHYKERKIVKTAAGRRVKLGRKLFKAADIKRSMANKAYWSRIRSLAAAMAITKPDGSPDLNRARKIDNKMMNVPDNVRRRIYDECVEKATAGFYNWPSHLRGTDLLPKSRKEAREKWSKLGDGHGNKKGKGRTRHSRGVR